MDQETRVYYDELKSSLRTWYPEQTAFTQDQINEHSVPRIGATIQEMDTKREGAVEAIRATTRDLSACAEAEAKVIAYYNQLQENFDRHYTAAVDEICRENGLSPEGPILQDRPQQPDGADRTVTAYATAVLRPQHLGSPEHFLNGDQVHILRENEKTRVQNLTPPGDFQNGRVVIRPYESPRIIEPIDSTRGMPEEQENGDKGKSLTPQQQLIPPLSYIQKFQGVPRSEPQQGQSIGLSAKAMNEMKAAIEQQRKKEQKLTRGLDRDL